MFPLVISFYTKNTPYQLDAQHMIASCEKFGLEHYIEGVESWGSWELNCSYKPFFIAEKLQAFKRPLLWVDVDAIFVSKPKRLQVFEDDFAVYSQKDLARDHPSKVRSGTVYVNDTEGGWSMVKAWAQECQRQLTDPARKEEFWDQIALRQVVQQSIKGGHLPLSYIKIMDHPGDAKCTKPVIVHTAASRHAKR